jgi:hypothetical protein
MKSLKLYAPVLLTLVMVLMPLFVLAQSGTNPSFPNGTNPPIPNGTNPPQTSLFSGKIDNPLKVTNFCDLIRIVLQAILIIGMPVAVVFLVYVGLKFITARGNPEKIKLAQQNLYWTIVGIAVFLGAWAIAKVIASTLGALGVGAVNECIR